MDFSALSGIAMYVKIPDVTQTNFMIRLIDDGWTTWAEVGDSAELTLSLIHIWPEAMSRRASSIFISLKWAMMLFPVFRLYRLLR